MTRKKAERLFCLANILSSRKGYRAAELAETLGVSERTIYRDPRVIAESNRAGGVLFVKADVTHADSLASREMRRLRVGTPPMILFYDSAGKEVPPRLAEYSTEQLLERIRKLRGVE